jgi:hypothetical protein
VTGASPRQRVGALTGRPMSVHAVNVSYSRPLSREGRKQAELKARIARRSHALEMNVASAKQRLQALLVQNELPAIEQRGMQRPAWSSWRPRDDSTDVDSLVSVVRQRHSASANASTRPSRLPSPRTPSIVARIGFNFSDSLECLGPIAPVSARTSPIKLPPPPPQIAHWSVLATADTTTNGDVPEGAHAPSSSHAATSGDSGQACSMARSSVSPTSCIDTRPTTSVSPTSIDTHPIPTGRHSGDTHPTTTHTLVTASARGAREPSSDGRAHTPQPSRTPRQHHSEHGVLHARTPPLHPSDVMLLKIVLNQSSRLLGAAPFDDDDVARLLPFCHTLTLHRYQQLWRHLGDPITTFYIVLRGGLLITGLGVTRHIEPGHGVAGGAWMRESLHLNEAIATFPTELLALRATAVKAAALERTETGRALAELCVRLRATVGFTYSMMLLSNYIPFFVGQPIATVRRHGSHSAQIPWRSRCDQ